MAPQDPGFVFDEVSGLYFHASSGFYHDPKAGWYYNTHDGVYYKFEEGTYVPIAAKANSGNAVPDSEISENLARTESPSLEEQEKTVLNPQESGPSKSATEAPDETAGTQGSSKESDQSPRDSANGNVSDSQGDAASLDVGFPLWYYDSLRSTYWYYDKDSRAYYRYYEDNTNLLTETPVDGESTIDLVVHGNGEASVGGVERLTMQESEEDGDNTRPTSGWVEQTLIDLYLKGYPREAAEEDNGPWITSADIFSEGFLNVPSDVDSRYWEVSDNRSSLANNNQLSCAGFTHDLNGVQASVDESDNEGSEELEEGEWVPDEPLRIVDESRLIGDGKDAFGHSEEDVGRNTWEPKYSAGSNGDYGCCNEGLEEGEMEDGEIGHDNGDLMNNFEGEYYRGEKEDVKVNNGQRSEEEQWQAQFGQVVREKSREHIIPGAVDLWDWMIVEMEPSLLKPGKLVKKLVGRIASSVTKLVSASSGLIRTSAIRGAELDFVKVSSGKIYRLRRPSLKHLTSLGTYDSSNPTKDWGFPLLGLSLLDTSEEALSDVGTGAHNHTQSRIESHVSKPFVPNTGHWQFQRLLSTNTKKGRTVPAALLASKHLSPEEIVMNEERKQKYRDRAAERRILHGGFGTGPGQKGLTPHEQDKVDADNAVGMEGALKTAAAAPRLGRDNVGKRMLEGMGWKEGQTLGVEGGLVNPLQAQGNDGRAGLGWK